MKLVPIIKINPLQLKKTQHAKLLGLLLSQQSAESYFFAGRDYDVEVPRPPQTPQRVRIRLSYPLLNISKPSKPSFAILANANLKLKHGYSSELKIRDGGVHNVLGKLNLENDAAVCNQYKTPRVIKRVHYNRDIDEESRNICEGFDIEVAALKRIPALYSNHEPVIYQDAVIEAQSTMKACLMMKQAKGKPFSEADEANTVSKLYLFSIRLLRAYHEQLHAVGWVHCDVKPDNIFFDPKSLTFRVIDFNVAKKINQKAQPGNLDYSAPEAEWAEFNWPLTPATDGYAIALMLRKLCWNGGKRFDDNSAPTNEAIMAIRDKILNREEPALSEPLFQAIDEEALPLDCQAEIKAVLDGLNQFEPQQRMDLPTAISQLESSFTHYRALKYPASEQRFALAKQAAMNLRDVFSQLSDEQNSLDETKKTIWPEAKMVRALRAALLMIADTPLVVQHFTDLLGVAAFHGLKTKQDIIAMAEVLLNRLTDNTQAILRGVRQFEAAKPWLEKNQPNEVDAIKTDFDRLRNSYFKQATKLNQCRNEAQEIVAPMRVGFDELAEFNRLGDCCRAKMQAKIQNLQQFLQRHKAAYVTTYADLVLRLKPQEDAQDELQPLKNKLRIALQGYLHARKTLTQRRYKDVIQLIDLADKASSQEAFIATVQERKQQIRTGFFGRSKLRKALDKTIIQNNTIPRGR